MRCRGPSRTVDGREFPMAPTLRPYQKAPVSNSRTLHNQPGVGLPGALPALSETPAR